MRILVKVTKEILERSKMCGADTCFELLNPTNENCGIALSIRCLFPKAIVNMDYTYLLGDGPRNRKISKIRLPEIATDFIHEFDSLKKTPEERVNMSPISFEIDVPNEVIDSIGIGQVYKILSESKTLEYVNV